MIVATINGDAARINGQPATIGATTGMTTVNLAFGVNGVGGPGVNTDFNAITSADSGLKSSNLTDSNVVGTGISLEFNNTWSGTGSNDIVAETHGYPALAADEFFSQPASERDMDFIFPLSHWGLPHTLTVWGATNSTGTGRDGTFTLTDSGAGVLGFGDHDAANDGAAAPLSIAFTMPDDGIVNLAAIEADPGDTAVYITVMTISYTIDQLPPLLVTPYVNQSVTVGDTINIDLTTAWAGATEYIVSGLPNAVIDTAGVISGYIAASGVHNISVTAINGLIDSDNTTSDSFILEIKSGLPNKTEF